MKSIGPGPPAGGSGQSPPRSAAWTPPGAHRLAGSAPRRIEFARRDQVRHPEPSADSKRPRVNPGERTDASVARSPREISGQSGGAAAPDMESRTWVRDLRVEAHRRDAAVTRLHVLLLRVARTEASRRRSRLPDAVLNELDDLCVQAASDAVVAILGKLDDYRGAARFTTWASKFVILEFSSRLRCRVWHRRELKADAATWERFADQAPSAQQTVEYRQVFDVLDRAVEEDLSERQRMVFSAAVLEDVPIDVLAERLGSTRGAVYKTVYDARSKLRGALARAGYGEVLA